MRSREPGVPRQQAAPKRKTDTCHMQVERRINGSLSSKLYGFEKVLSPLVAKACISVCPKNSGNFNVDNVRVVKIPGGGVGDAQLVHGVVIKREPEGTIRSAKKAKVAVFAQGVDTASTETKVITYTPAMIADYDLGEALVNLKLRGLNLGSGV
jgi:T-complex protein 1 subunit theta